MASSNVAEQIFPRAKGCVFATNLETPYLGNNSWLNTS
jgi:hypothetical protein